MLCAFTTTTPGSHSRQQLARLQLRICRRCIVHGQTAAGLLLTSVLVLSASTQALADHPEARAEYKRNNDPAEPSNRTIFAANQLVDRHALQPVARGYDGYVPAAEIRRRLGRDSLGDVNPDRSRTEQRGLYSMHEKYPRDGGASAKRVAPPMDQNPESRW